MKRKLGILLCAMGIFAIAITGVKFVVQKERDTTESTKGQVISFPWITTLGAALAAGGIILIATNRRVS